MLIKKEYERLKYENKILKKDIKHSKQFSRYIEEMARKHAYAFYEALENVDTQKMLEIFSKLRKYKKGDKIPDVINLPKVNRVELIGDKGRETVKYNQDSVKIEVQDGGKTLKIFTSDKKCEQ